MDTKKINKVIRVAKSVARQSTKLVGAALPIGTVIANGFDSHNAYPTRPEMAFKHFLSKFNGINEVDGRFSGDRLMQGTGALLISGVTGWLISQIA